MGIDIQTMAGAFPQRPLNAGTCCLKFSEVLRIFCPACYMTEYRLSYLPTTQQHSKKASSALCFSDTQLRKTWRKSSSFTECIHEINSARWQVTSYPHSSQKHTHVFWMGDVFPPCLPPIELLWTPLAIHSIKPCTSPG